MARIFGVGPGTFLLTFIWTLSTIVAFFFAKSRGNYVPGLACCLLSTAVTSILVSLRKTHDGSSIHGYDDDLGYDRMFIPRVFLLTFVIVCLIVGVFGLYVTHWTVPRLTSAAKPIRARSRSKTFTGNLGQGQQFSWAEISKVDKDDPQLRVKRDNFVSRAEEINRLRKRF